MAETAAMPDVIDAIAAGGLARDELMASEDTIEGMTAFAEKRRPQWRNR
jgi:acetyl-CoA C-acetyltransferase